MADYEFFKKEIKIRGRHARMADEMVFLNDYEHTYFKRLIDLYILAAVVGFRVNRKVPEDISPFETKTIFLQQVLDAKEDLDYILRMMILLDNKDNTNNIDNDKCVKMAFRGPQTKEEFEQWQKMFDDYVRGGIEELHERLVVYKADSEDEFHDDKTANLMSTFKWFS